MLWVTWPPHYFTALPTAPFPCSRRAIQPRLLYNCHLASALPDLWTRCVRLYTPPGTKNIWFFQGQLNSPRWGLETAIWWDRDDFIFSSLAILILAERRHSNWVLCFALNALKVLHLFLIFASASVNSKYQTLKFCLTLSQFLTTSYIAKNSLLFFFVFITSVSCILCQQKPLWWSSGKTT